MKKIMSLIAMFFVAMTVNAQFYVGGSVNFASEGGGDEDQVSTFTFAPEVGYVLNNDWTVGGVLTFENKAMGAEGSTFGIGGYARRNFIKSGTVTVFVEGGIDIMNYSPKGGDSMSSFSAELRPGIAVALSDKFSLVAKTGVCGFKSFDESTSFNLGLNNNNISFGLYYNL